MIPVIFQSGPPIPAPSVSGGPIEAEVFIGGVLVGPGQLLGGVPLDCRNVVVTWPESSDPTATIEVSLAPINANAAALYSEGAPLKGPDSPTWTVFAELSKGRLCMIEGWTSDYKHNPGTGWATFSVTCSSAHKALLSEDRENLIPDLPDWVNIVNAKVSADGSNGVKLEMGTDINNPRHFVEAGVNLGVAGKAYDVFGSLEVRVPSTMRGVPVRGVQWMLVNLDTGHENSQFTDLSGVPRDVWTRLGPESKKIPPGHNYRWRIFLQTPGPVLSATDKTPKLAIDKGARFVEYRNAEVFIDRTVGVDKGSDAADLACVMWQEQFAATNTGWSVSKVGASDTVYLTDQRFPIRERSDPRSNMPGPVEWVAVPWDRRVLVGGLGSVGGVHTNLLAGFPSGDFITTEIQSGTDGMATRVFELGPWGDACNGEGKAERSALHPWSISETAQTGTDVPALPGLAASRLAKVSRGKSTAYVNQTAPRADGLPPIAWWGEIMPGDYLPNRVDDGPAQLGDTQRVTQMVADFGKQTLTVTVASEAA